MASKAARRRAKKRRNLKGWAAVVARLDDNDSRKEQRRARREANFTDARVNPDTLTEGFLSPAPGKAVKDLPPTANHLAVWRESRAELVAGARVRPTPGAGSATGAKKGGGQ